MLHLARMPRHCQHHLYHQHHLLATIIMSKGLLDGDQTVCLRMPQCADVCTRSVKS